jgi:hypothetical protein
VVNPLNLPAPLDQLWDDELLPTDADDLSFDDPDTMTEVLKLADHDRPLVRLLVADSVAQVSDFDRFLALLQRLEQSGPAGAELSALAICFRQQAAESPHLPAWREGLAQVVKTGRTLRLHLTFLAWAAGDVVPEWMDRVLLELSDADWPLFDRFIARWPREVVRYLRDAAGLVAPDEVQRHLEAALADDDPPSRPLPDTMRWEAERRYWVWQDRSATGDVPLLLEVQAGLWLQDAGQMDRGRYLLTAASRRLPAHHVLRFHAMADSDADDPDAEESQVVGLALERLARTVSGPDELLPLAFLAAASWHTLPRFLKTLPQATNARAWAEAVTPLVTALNRLLAEDPSDIADPIAWAAEQLITQYRRSTRGLGPKPAVQAVYDALEASGPDFVMQVALLSQQFEERATESLTDDDEPE